MSDHQNFLKRQKATPDLEITQEERNLLRVWANAPAPGEAKAAGISIAVPPIAARNSERKRSIRFAQQFTAGALLFLVGYLVGHRQVYAPKPINNQTAAAPVGVVHQLVTSPTPVASAAKGNASPPPATSVAPEAHGEDCKAPQIYKGKDGYFRIDTVLCQSGSRATWVINPSLELANARNSQPKEETHQ